MKKVSVIMPCFNDGEYIEESIESVLIQTYKNVELIIINDGSTDKKTLDILNNLSNPIIKVLHSNTNKGPAAARNYGIDKASGEYILPLDSDDLIDSTYIEKCVSIMEKNKNVGIVYCYADLIGEKSGRWELPDYSLEKMLLDNIIFVTAMFRKEDWETIGGFNVELKAGMEDYDFWLSILQLQKEVVQIKEVLFYYRIKAVSRTTNFSKDINIVKETYRTIYLNHTKLYEMYKDEYSMVLRDALIDQIYINKQLSSMNSFFEKLSGNKIIKKLVKKIILKRG